jgi:hypothetical protein
MKLNRCTTALELQADIGVIDSRWCYMYGYPHASCFTIAWEGDGAMFNVDYAQKSKPRE